MSIRAGRAVHRTALSVAAAAGVALTGLATAHAATLPAR